MSLFWHWDYKQSFIPKFKINYFFLLVIRFLSIGVLFQYQDWLSRYSIPVIKIKISVTVNDISIDSVSLWKIVQKSTSTKHKGPCNSQVNTVQYQTIDNNDISTLWGLSTSAKGFTATSAHKINKSNQPLLLINCCPQREITSNYTSSSFTDLDFKNFWHRMRCFLIMTSSNGNIFGVTCPLWWESIGHRRSWPWNPIVDTSAKPIYESKTYRSLKFFYNFNDHIMII